MNNQDILKEILSHVDDSTFLSFSLTSKSNIALTSENHTWKLRTVQRYGQKFVGLKESNKENWIHRHLSYNSSISQVNLIPHVQNMHYRDYYNLLSYAPIFSCRIVQPSDEIKKMLTPYVNDPDIWAIDWPTKVYTILNNYAKDIGMQRGDIISLLELFEDNLNFDSDGGRNDHNYDLFYNGTELIPPGSGSHYYIVPSEFQVCSEFPIHHWNEWQMWDKTVHFDFKKWLTQPNKNNIIKVHIEGYYDDNQGIVCSAYKFQYTPSFTGIEYTHLIVSHELLCANDFLERLSDSKKFKIYEYPDDKEFYPEFIIILPDGIHSSQVMLLDF